MSRPNGPVRHPGMPEHPDYSNTQNDGRQPQYDYAPQQPASGGQAHGNQGYAQQPNTSSPPSYGQGQPHPSAGYQHRPDASQPQYGYEQAQPQTEQPAPTQQPPRYQNQPSGLDASYGTGPSWADLNQPPGQAGGQHNGAQGAHHEPHPTYVDAAGQAPQYRDPNAFGQAQQPASAYQQAAPSNTFGHDGYGGQHQPHVQSTTPTAASTGYDFASFDAPQPARHPDLGASAQTDQRVDWGLNDFAQSGDTSGAGAQHGSSEFGYATETPTMDAHQQPVHVDDAYAGDDEDFEYEDEHEGGRGRGVFIAAALAGAIVIGGGVAYGYQALFGGAPSDKPPIVKGAQGPAKVKPADPGGRKFAHTDSKIMGRLGAASGKTNDPASGARRVSTLRIGRDGSVISPASPAAAPSGPRMVTGMTLGGGEVAAASAADANAAARKPIVVNPPKSNTPVKIANVAPAAPKVTKPVATAPPVPKKPVVTNNPKPAPKKVAVAKPAAPAAPVGPKPTGAGYVAVLASVPVSNSSRMDSLKQFADMQQKYGTALQNKTPDVQTANLGAKGTYHRLIAGPPGSAQSARSVCDSLKAAGYTSCWVLAY